MPLGVFLGLCPLRVIAAAKSSSVNAARLTRLAIINSTLVRPHRYEAGPPWNANKAS